MNLNAIYDLFFNGGELSDEPLWPGRKMQKISFFNGIIPMRLRGINEALWKNKSRRSRFLSNSFNEPLYVEDVKDYIIKNPDVISNIESRVQRRIKNDVDVNKLANVIKNFISKNINDINEEIYSYLVGDDDAYIKDKYERSLAFIIIYAILGIKANVVYRIFFLKMQNSTNNNNYTLNQEDHSSFISEFPPDGQKFKPGQRIIHTWVIQNNGSIVWKDRYFECVNPQLINSNIALNIKLKQNIYPGEKAYVVAEFNAPCNEGAYVLKWKMKNRDGTYSFPQSIGLIIHFYVENNIKDISSNGIAQIVSENPRRMQQYRVGEIIEHTWTLKNVSQKDWNNCYFECTNCIVFNYAINELRVPIKFMDSKRERDMMNIIKPGEETNVTVKFHTPYQAGIYIFEWRIKDKNGNDVALESPSIELEVNVCD